jgi:hypothetical protein
MEMGKGNFIDDTSSGTEPEEDVPEQESPAGNMEEVDSEEDKLNAEILKAEDSERANYTDNNFWKTDE